MTCCGEYTSRDIHCIEGMSKYCFNSEVITKKSLSEAIDKGPEWYFQLICLCMELTYHQGPSWHAYREYPMQY